MWGMASRWSQQYAGAFQAVREADAAVEQASRLKMQKAAAASEANSRVQSLIADWIACSRAKVDLTPAKKNLSNTPLLYNSVCFAHLVQMVLWMGYDMLSVFQQSNACDATCC